jgi:vacuolar-type H+-ATPase subunit F/Vma7
LGRIAVVGEQSRVQGFALPGALPVLAETAQEVSAAMSALPDDVTVLVLTTRAADALGGERADFGRDRLIVVMPP